MRWDRLVDDPGELSAVADDRFAHRVHQRCACGVADIAFDDSRARIRAEREGVTRVSGKARRRVADYGDRFIQNGAGR